MDIDEPHCIWSRTRFLSSDFFDHSFRIQSFPPIIWVEKADTFVLKLFLPGYEKEHLEVQLDGEKTVRINGRRPERGSTFTMICQIPQNANPAVFLSTFDRDALRIRFGKLKPKQEFAKFYSNVCPPGTGSRVLRHKWVEEVEAYVLMLYLPVYEREHLSVQLDGERNVRINGRQPENCFSFSKTFPIPENVDIAGITCTFDRVELRIRFNKLAAVFRERKDESAATNKSNQFFRDENIENSQSNISSATSDGEASNGKVDKTRGGEIVKNPGMNLNGNVINMNINRLGL